VGLVKFKIAPVARRTYYRSAKRDARPRVENVHYPPDPTSTKSQKSQGRHENHHFNLVLLTDPPSEMA
jgi:hypothetical protein